MQLHSVTKNLSRALVLAGVLLFGVSVMAQSTFVITNGEAQKRKFAEVGQVFLAINEGYTGVEAVTAFNERCVWHRTGKTGYYYQNDAEGNTYFLRRNGDNLQLDVVPAGQLLSSTTSWYDWSFGVATQELGGDPQYHWIVTNADNTGWKMSGNTYGRPGFDATKGDNGLTNDGYGNSAITNDQVSNSETRAYGLNRAATFNPVVSTVVEPQNVYEAAGANGLSAATITTTNYGYMIEVDGANNKVTANVSGITSYTSQTTPGYTMYELQYVTNPSWTCTSDKYNNNSCYNYGYAGGDYEQYTHTTVQTWYCYGGAVNTAAPAAETSPSVKEVSSYVWTLSGPAAHFLSLESTGNVISKTVTDPSSIVVYYTTLSSRNLSATLTLTAYYSDGTTQTLATDVHITNPVTPTGLNVASTTHITRGETATIPVAVLPHNAVQLFNYGPTTDPFSKEGTNLLFDGTSADPGEYTTTLVAALSNGIGVMATATDVTVYVHPEAPDGVSATASATGVTLQGFLLDNNNIGYDIYYSLGTPITDPSTVDLTSLTKFNGSVVLQPNVPLYAISVVDQTTEGDGLLRSMEVYTYLPTISSGTGVTLSDGNVAVVLNDLEDHSWSYYSDPASPIRSLNPADVKITYYGNGTNNMTSTSTADAPANSAFDADATGVKVNIGGDDENTFVYYKTLERTNGSTATSASAANGNLKYTTIPNPFQVRPVYDESGTEPEPAPRTIVIVTSRSGNNTSGFDNGARLEVYWDGTRQRNITNRTTTTIQNVPVGTEVTLVYVPNSNSTQNGRSRVAVYYDSEATANQIFATYTPTGNNQERTFIVQAESSSSTTDNKYRGFYGWRIKSLRGGLTVSGKEVGDIISAEQEIEFVTTNEYGNEIELEALWAQAYVNSGYHSSVTYERNFVVGSTAVNYPATYSSIYPNGTTNGTTVATSITNSAYNIGRSLSYDSKFENMNVTGTTLTAAGHNLIVGRGVSGTIDYVRGMGESMSSLNYRMRLETGSYNYVSFTCGYMLGSNDYQGDNGYNYRSVSGNVDIQAVLGNDYDRANNASNFGATDNLKVNNNVIYGVYKTINDANRKRETLNLTIKSGKIGSNVTINNGYTADAYQSIYMSVAGSYTYTGRRNLIIEGGEISGIAGGIDGYFFGTGTNNQNTDLTGVSRSGDTISFTLRMKGGHVRGAVYGGAAKSPASGDRHMIFTGGEVNGWIGNGCNGTDNAGGKTYGASKLYFGGNATCGGTNSNVSMNGSRGGIIFGAGKGYPAQDGTSGEMTYGTTVVVADKANVERNVYGGGNYGYALVNTRVYILGGSIGGNVFGGSKLKNGPTVAVNMDGGTVTGSVYGGSDSLGTITESVEMNFLGGTVKGSVYGGGKGNPTRVTKNVEVTVGGNAIIETDVYGGSEEGVVNSTMTSPAANTANQTTNSYTTTVNIEGGKVKGNVYGGGFGTTDSYAHVAGNVTVNVSDGIIDGAVFGCNNANGRPLGKVNVNISGGTMGNIYGGGNQAAYGRSATNTAVEAPHVLMTGGHVLQNVFGGGLGNTAIVNQNTDVKVQAGTVDGNVYGGGAKANVTGNTNVEIGK